MAFVYHSFYFLCLFFVFVGLGTFVTQGWNLTMNCVRNTNNKNNNKRECIMGKEGRPGEGDRHQRVVPNID